ncbi:HNH endonuclease, partial [Aeromonas veronii]
MFNVVRNEPAPASLANKRKYDSQDVWEALSRVFHKKCYICETKEPQDINVEHFIPHQGDENLKFDWNNLYFSCGRCNNIKLTQYDDLIDCCDTEVDVLRAIKHMPPATPYAQKIQIEAQVDDEKTNLTAELLDKIFNSTHTPNKAVSASFLRRKIFAQYNMLLDLLKVYYAETTLQQEKETALERMKILIKPSSPYSAFVSANSTSKCNSRLKIRLLSEVRQKPP